MRHSVLTAPRCVCAGPYLDDPVVREKFSDAYRHMTDAFLAFPLCVPGTAVWKGRQGRLYIIEVGVESIDTTMQPADAAEWPAMTINGVLL